MIKANELRIGNWVESNKYSKGGKPERHFQQIRWSHFLDGKENPIAYIDPIPLTPEILEQCGWKYNEATYLFEYPDQVRCDLKYNEISRSYTMLNGVLGALICKRIFHLHQLQNLFFAITGTELNVNILTVNPNR